MKFSRSQELYFRDYLKKSGDEITAINKGEGVNVVDFDGGWIEYSIEDGKIWIDTMYSKYNHKQTEEIWQHFAKSLKKKGFNKVMFWTKRNNKAFSRLWNAKTVGYIMEVNL